MSQQSDISIAYGRFYSPYKYTDYGGGFKNNSSSNYNFFPSFTFNRYFSEKISIESGFFLTLYEQYYGTRKYSLAFESNYTAMHLAIRGAYSFYKKRKFESRIKAGFSIGFNPDKYQGEYVEMFIYPYVDSITRGNIRRNFATIFPMISTGFDVSCKIAKRFKIALAGNYQKGFLKLSEYDIYYNDGNGENDQRAKQWGTGDFYGFQLGLHYILNSSKKSKDTHQKRH